MLALRFSAIRSEIKENSDDVHWTDTKKLYARNDIKKLMPNIRF